MKTIEQVLREFFATGYDPVKLNVRARSINEENLDVVIEGHLYSVRGNAVMFIAEGKPGAEQSGNQVPQNDGLLPEEGNTFSPRSEPASVCEGVSGGSVDAAVAGGVSGEAEPCEAGRIDSDTAAPARDDMGVECDEGDAKVVG